MEMKLPPLIAIVGPTAVGKTRLAIDLAKELDGEIVSADSRQVYRFMDIGTAKPTLRERRSVPHHLIDVVEPDDQFTLAQYQELAFAAIDGIIARGKVPFLIGGTGLYVRAVLEGFHIPRVIPSLALRECLYRRASEEGAGSLHNELATIDPVAAGRIDPRNVRRIVRALEVYHETGIPISRLQRKQAPPYRILKIGLTMERAELYRRIDQRVERMIEDGLVEEVKGLVERGYGYEMSAMSGLGYRQIGLYLQGRLELSSAIELIKRETRRFVRQQYTWFRQLDETIHWFTVAEGIYDRIRTLILSFLNNLGEVY